MQAIAELNLPGYAIGGLAVGESAGEMYAVIEAVEPHMPKDRPRYLMGVGTPDNILEAVWRGIDFFDCVLPARNARHGHLYTEQGVINLNNQKYAHDPAPIDQSCGCPVCREGPERAGRAYLRHLLKAGEVLGLRLCVMHNLWFYNNFFKRIREALDAGTFELHAQPEERTPKGVRTLGEKNKTLIEKGGLGCRESPVLSSHPPEREI